MLMKCVRENETTYYIPSQIQKISISRVYGDDDQYDVAFYLNGTMEIVKVLESAEEAEAFVKKIDEMMSKSNDSDIFDLNA